jgi:hypothetical protein
MSSGTYNAWKASGLENILWAILLLGGFFALHLWILPSFGVHTCIGGTCAVAPGDTLEKDSGIPDPGARGAHAPGG